MTQDGRLRLLPGKSHGLFIAAAVLLALLVPAGCGADQPAPPGSAELSDTSGRAAGGFKAVSDSRLSSVDTWAYLIQDQSEPGNIGELAASGYELLVIDQTRSLKGEEDFDSAAEVELLKSGAGGAGAGRLVICYLDAGQAESYRWYWQDGWNVGDPEWIAAADPEGWDDNFPVRFWRPGWQGIMKGSLDRIIDDGYDGVYLDWLEIYSFKPVADAAAAEGLDPQVELEKFVGELAAHARARRPGFIFMAQNAAELGGSPSYVALFDGIAQEHVWFDGAGDPESGEVGDQRTAADETEEYLDWLEVWQHAGKPVFNVEYAEEPDNVEDAYRLGAENGFRTYVTLRLLDSLSGTPPLG